MDSEILTREEVEGLLNLMSEPRKERNMNFIEAVRAAKETGCKIKRTRWSKDDALYCRCSEMYSNDEEEEKLRYVANILADDWQIVADPPKEIHLMGFVEAMAKVKSGYAVKRKHWVHAAIVKSGVGMLRKGKIKDEWLCRDFIPNHDDIAATDWVVIYGKEAT
jgi:hypothetical protein